ncbi:HlyD family secretion protein [Yersinia aleksiciae]|uniref:Putative microcin H47 secretion ATP-binding protein mchF n=1 Tax=Yersinia aleksiciae TaxID=263819 RepID=A0A0T9U1E0_YERAE|nr:HlyD family efflux transporter periplasmic adaptor subunit [Yersinia aleksiciae]CNL14110.1 putative microcin H47 secretion ATP-binding protein mchF [Yersinia aleksiciae]
MVNIHPIFRQEAIEHRSHYWLGSPQVMTPVGASLWAMVALVLIVSLITFMVMGTYTQRARLTGTVVHQPAVARIIASHDGVIVSSVAEEGKAVRAGEVIFILNRETQTEYGATSHEITVALKAQKTAIEREIALTSEASETERNFLLQRLKNRDAEQQKMDDLIAKSTQQTAWLLEKTEHFKTLVRQGIALETEHMARRSEYYSAAVQLKAHQRQRVKLQGEILDIEARLAALNSAVEASLERLHRQAAQLDHDLVATEVQRELHITAPIEGILTGFIGLTGNTIQAGQELATVVPTSGRSEVEVFAPSDAIGELREGQTVRLRFDAYPYQWFGQYDGVVTSVSAATVSAADRGVSASGERTYQSPRRYFQIRITPKNNAVLMAGETYPLRPGIGVETDIFIRKRPLYEWLLWPLNNSRNKVQSESGGAA